jgi:hypothetical protein
MKRWIAFVVVALGLVGLVVSPASANSPAHHGTDSVVGDVITCDDGLVLTAVSGYFAVTTREGTSASGNMMITGTGVPHGVVLVDEDGNTYRAAGAIWFGGAFNAQTGGFTFTDTEHVMFLGSNGLVGSIRTTTHVSPNGREVSVDMGSCTAPEEE